MNEANEFYETMRSRRDTVLSWRDDSQNGELPDDISNRPTSVSGKGSGSPVGQIPMMRNGPLSPATRKVDQTPNG